MKDWRGNDYEIGSIVAYARGSGRSIEMTEGKVVDIWQTYDHDCAWRRYTPGDELPLKRRWNQHSHSYEQAPARLEWRVKVQPTGRSSRDFQGDNRPLKEVTIEVINNITALQEAPVSSINYTFQKVEHRASKSVKCHRCGKRMKRSKTFMQTVNPFNKNADGITHKTAAQIMKEHLVAEEKWRNDREWCAPCWEKVYTTARHLKVGNVIEGEDGGPGITVTSITFIKGFGGSVSEVVVNGGLSFEPYRHVMLVIPNTHDTMKT